MIPSKVLRRAKDIYEKSRFTSPTINDSVCIALMDRDEFEKCMGFLRETVNTKGDYNFDRAIAHAEEEENEKTH